MKSTKRAERFCGSIQCTYLQDSAPIAPDPAVLTGASRRPSQLPLVELALAVEEADGVEVRAALACACPCACVEPNNRPPVPPPHPLVQGASILFVGLEWDALAGLLIACGCLKPTAAKTAMRIWRQRPCGA